MLLVMGFLVLFVPSETQFFLQWHNKQVKKIKMNIILEALRNSTM